MSDGTATYKDLLDLVKLVIEKVKKEKGIDLVPEVRVVVNN
jgi:UDP-N-acetylenolpyruvoylglucosamine reductase